MALPYINAAVIVFVHLTKNQTSYFNMHNGTQCREKFGIRDIFLLLNNRHSYLLVIIV